MMCRLVGRGGYEGGAALHIHKEPLKSMNRPMDFRSINLVLHCQRLQVHILQMHEGGIDAGERNY